MALRNRDDNVNSYASFTSASMDFLKTATGYSGPIGASMFMVRTLFTGTVTSIIMGSAGATLGGMLIGTAGLPFVICSCAGFIFGAIGYYTRSLRDSLIMLERYPRLLQLHLDANFPQRNFLRWRDEQLRPSVFAGSWTLQSMLVVSWLTAQPALDQITERREQMIVEEAQARLLSDSRDAKTITDE